MLAAGQAHAAYGVHEQLRRLLRRLHVCAAEGWVAVGPHVQAGRCH